MTIAICARQQSDMSVLLSISACAAIDQKYSFEELRLQDCPPLVSFSQVAAAAPVEKPLRAMYVG